MYVQLLYLKQRTSITIYCQNMHLTGFITTSTARGSHARETRLVYIYKHFEIVTQFTYGTKDVEIVKITLSNMKIQHLLASGTLQLQLNKI